MEKCTSWCACECSCCHASAAAATLGKIEMWLITTRVPNRAPGGGEQEPIEPERCSAPVTVETGSRDEDGLHKIGEHDIPVCAGMSPELSQVVANGHRLCRCRCSRSAVTHEQKRA